MDLDSIFFSQFHLWKHLILNFLLGFFMWPLETMICKYSINFIKRGNK